MCQLITFFFCKSAINVKNIMEFDNNKRFMQHQLCLNLMNMAIVCTYHLREVISYYNAGVMSIL